MADQPKIQNVKPINIPGKSKEAVQKQILELENRIKGIDQRRKEIDAEKEKIYQDGISTPDIRNHMTKIEQEHTNLTKETNILQPQLRQLKEEWTKLSNAPEKIRLPGQANLLPVINADPSKNLQKSWLPELGTKNPKNVDDLIENVTANAIDFSVYIILFGVAIIKDILDIVINLIPFINLLSFAISAPFTIIIFTITLITGKFGPWRIGVSMVAQLLDWIPVISFIPITTISIFLLVIMEKTDMGKIVSQIPIPGKNLAKGAVKK